MKTIDVSGQQALAELDRLRQEFNTSGLYPILFGDEDDFERIQEGLEELEDADSILDESRSIDVPTWFAQKPSEDPELYQAEEGEWPSEVPPEMGIITHLDLGTTKPKKTVVIGLLEIRDSSDAFAPLNWGGWNDCPFPQHHCAIHRYWNQKWGSDVVSISGDIVQCSVARPPQDRESALALAREQYLYCYDIVEQGTETVAALAASLLDSRTWYFWWD